MTEQMLTEFMAYLDARADAVEFENQFHDQDIWGIAGTEMVQLCSSASNRMPELFDAVCAKFEVKPTEKRYHRNGRDRVEREIEYRGLRVFTYDYINVGGEQQ